MLKLVFDPAFQTTVSKVPDQSGVLASQPIMPRRENHINAKELIRLGPPLGDIFLAFFDKALKTIVIDMDPTSVHCHGAQQLSLFNGCEDEYCLMPTSSPAKLPAPRESWPCSSVS